MDGKKGKSETCSKSKGIKARKKTVNTACHQIKIVRGIKGDKDDEDR